MSVTLAEHEFVSVLRRGAAAHLTAADPLTGPLPDRGKLDVRLTVTSSGGPGAGTDQAKTTALLLGPGDVIGLDPRHVTTDPPNLTPNFEPNYFPAIEFHHPDLPWFFTPAAAADTSSGTPDARLRPWLCMAALADGEYEVPADRPPDPLPSIRVASAASLPNLDESWAWAHVQVAGGIGNADLSTLISTEPGRVLSRLVCPRRLRPQMHYRAFLVPAFELGRKAGLGETLPSGPNLTTAPAWKAGDTNVLLPVYYSFEFWTSEAGDFASLVRQLEPRALDESVGVRPMAVDRAGVGWGIRSAGSELGLGGALRAASTKDTNWAQVGPTDKGHFQADLAAAVNRGSAAPSDPAQDPRIVPPLYGRWHAARSTVDPARAGWLNELNLDPRPRSMAGFGTRVVLDQRTQLLSGAWRQVDGIIDANAKLHAGQAGRETTAQVYGKHLVQSEGDTLLSATAPLQARLRASPITIREAVARSRLPAAALSPPFRRIARARGPVRRRQDYSPPPAGEGLITRLNRGDLSAAPPPANPPGLVTLEKLSGRLCPLPAWLGARLPLVALLALILAIGLLVVGLVLGFLLVAVAVVAVLLVLAGLRGRPLLARCRAAGIMRFDALTPRGFETAPRRPGFRVATAGEPNPGPRDGPALPDRPSDADSPDARDFRRAAARLGSALGAFAEDQPEPEPADLAGLQASVLQELDPQLTVPARIGALIELGSELEWEPDDPLETIMAAPDFPQPMYEPLRDLSQELLLPGLDKVPPNTLALLVENHAFIEAYMVGLNHEMARQLLMDRFPTDQRGSYFRQFWDVRSYVRTDEDPSDPKELAEKLKDIPYIHRWQRSKALGDHRNRPAISPANLVLLVRGELMRRYPRAIVYACQAVWDSANKRHALGTAERHPLFRGTLAPDVTFLGFDLTVAEARGSSDRSRPQGWFFVFQQEPSGPRFGLEEPGPSPLAQVKEWSKLTWGHFGTPEHGFAPATAQPSPVAIAEGPAGDPSNPGDASNKWGEDSAQTAFITLRRPARVAIHAEMMLPDET